MINLAFFKDYKKSKILKKYCVDKKSKEATT